MKVLLVEDGPGIYNFVKQCLEEEAFTVRSFGQRKRLAETWAFRNIRPATAGLDVAGQKRNSDM